MGKAEENALEIECPKCKVPKGTYCTKGGLVRRPTKGFLHAERVQKACW